MIFGADSNLTHWKNLFGEDVNLTKKSFLDHLARDMNLSESDYKKYWKEMTDFRNKFVAHKEGYIKSVPFFDFAYKIVVCFDTWIREKIKPDIIDFPTFDVLTTQYKNDIRQTLQQISVKK